MGIYLAPIVHADFLVAEGRLFFDTSYHREGDGPLEIWFIGWTFWIGAAVGDFLRCTYSWSSPRTVKFVFYFVQTRGLLKKSIHEPTKRAGFIEFIIKRPCANYSWRPYSKTDCLFCGEQYPQYFSKTNRDKAKQAFFPIPIFKQGISTKWFVVFTILIPLLLKNKGSVIKF